MKAKRIIGGVMAVCVLCVGVLGIYKGYEWKMRLYYATTDEIIVHEGHDVPLDGEVPQEGMVGDPNLALTEMLAKIPADITTQMTQDGWQVTLTNEDLAQKYYQGVLTNVQAITDSRIKTIWITNQEANVRESAIHEVGHYVAYATGRLDKSEEFKEIYKAEKGQFVIEGSNASYGRSSSIEYFAEAFQETILHPESMQQHTPMTYNYINNVINSF